MSDPTFQEQLYNLCAAAAQGLVLIGDCSDRRKSQRYARELARIFRDARDSAGHGQIHGAVGGLSEALPRAVDRVRAAEHPVQGLGPQQQGLFGGGS